MKKKKIYLKALIQFIGTDKPADEFVERVIKEIQANPARDAALGSVLAGLSPDTLPDQFTNTLMQRIDNKRVRYIYPPIVPKWAWYAAAVLFLFLFGIPLTAIHGSAPPPHPFHLIIPYKNLFDHMGNESTTYVLILLSASLLLLMDYFYRIRLLKTY